MKKIMIIIRSVIFGALLTTLVYFLADHTPAPIYGNSLFKLVITFFVIALVGIYCRADSGTANRQGITFSLLISLVCVVILAIVNESSGTKFLFISANALQNILYMAIANLIISIVGIFKVEA